MKKPLRAGLALFLLASVLISLNAGRYGISPAGVASIVAQKIGLGIHLPPPTQEMEMVFWNIRLPRAILAFAVGGALSVSGVIFQAIFRNPLAAPDILGVSAGACFGAALALMYLPALAIGVQLSAFLFSVVAVSIAYTLASCSRDRSAAVLVLTGIVVAAVFQAGLSILMYIADPYDQLARIVFWTMGSFQVASWDKVRTVFIVVATGTALATIFGWRLNIMTQDDEQAMSLGMNIFRWRMFYVIITTVMVATCVSACGTITWVGLIVPHIARYLAGSEHKKLVVVATVFGGSFLLLMDTLARSLLTSEIPISIVTSIFGAPFLAYLVLSRTGGGLNIDHTN